MMMEIFILPDGFHFINENFCFFQKKKKNFKLVRFSLIFLFLSGSVCFYICSKVFTLFCLYCDVFWGLVSFCLFNEKLHIVFWKNIKVKIDEEVFEVGKEDLKVIRFPAVSTMHETFNDDSSGGEQGLNTELHFDSNSLGLKVVSKDWRPSLFPIPMIWMSSQKV